MLPCQGYMLFITAGRYVGATDGKQHPDTSTSMNDRLAKELIIMNSGYNMFYCLLKMGNIWVPIREREEGYQ